MSEKNIVNETEKRKASTDQCLVLFALVDFHFDFQPGDRRPPRVLFTYQQLQYATQCITSSSDDESYTPRKYLLYCKGS